MPKGPAANPRLLIREKLELTRPGVLPFACAQCYPEASEPSPVETPSTSHDTDLSHETRLTQLPTSSLPSESGLSVSLAKAAAAEVQNIEDHPFFLQTTQSRSDTERLNRFGGEEGETCASCRISLPDDVCKQLAPSVPASPNADYRGRNGSPVLRSRELVYSCGNNHPDPDEDLHLHASFPDSFHSSSTVSDASCHAHVLTYLSLRGPPDPDDYALLRRSSIRTLSCELLPRGLSSGPLCFGDTKTGYTIAFIFRLPDPMARGKRRSYAFLALAGKDARRAFRASPVIWRSFSRIANAIVNAAERYQEEEKRSEERSYGASKIGGRHYTPVSSFLTGRTVDPDGQPRRAGQIRARNLAEIVGNEFVFAELHAHFAALLQQLGSMFGGLPMAEERLVGDHRAPDDDPASPRLSNRPLDLERSSGEIRHSRGGSDLGLSMLDRSSRPKPIPITLRHPIVA
ncbi:hypothetical protein Egran_02111 [Elaphomyces granulatus]|uniref:UDENN FLCN/SMCR8-type domain-containing protein n=1 Tax=Elaphomyces granulatus TaxID=519963 RepID=A0A232M171_9EURO|nr:hypothetical protein Egran_02111 [Elaphomyces granulatus]